MLTSKIYIFILDFSSDQTAENIQSIKNVIADFSDNLDSKDYVQIILQNHSQPEAISGSIEAREQSA